jgi:uncharacterized protein (UPF0276 family)
MTTTAAAPPRAALPPAPKRHFDVPDLGCGVGLRVPHYGHIFDTESVVEVDFFEIISENFMLPGGRPMANLDRILARYPVVQHGVSLGVGATTPLDWDYLRQLKTLVRRTGTPWVSDHLCWTRNSHADLHDLLPLPYTAEAIAHVAARVRIVQDFLEVPFGLENVSSYLSYRASEMSEWAFYGSIVEEADCGMLLDVNNIYVSSFNHGFEPRDYLDSLPLERVLQYHLAGHTNKGAYILDTHSDFVIDAVWDLYRYACAKTGSVSTLVEWDDDIPAFEVVVAEANKARAIRQQIEAEGVA